MRIRLLIQFVALRYRLLWAGTRARKGRLALKAAITVWSALVAMVLTIGGVGAGSAAIRSGRGELTAGVVFGAVFLMAIGATVLLGPVHAAAFAESSLRRFPLSGAERFVVRHLAGVLDPLWLFVLMIYLGVGAGFSAAGSTPVAMAVSGALLLFATNYLTARTAVRAVEIVMETRTGAVLVFAVGALALAAAPAGMVALRERALERLVAPLSGSLAFTPPIQAAVVLSRPVANGGGAALAGLLVWVVGLAAAAVLAERTSVRRCDPRRQSRPTTLYDRLAAPAGPALAPLVAKTLRYIVRSPQVRFNFPVALPLVALVIAQAGGRSAPDAMFLASLGAVASIGVISTGAFSLNLFGFDAGGTRRYFLLPVPASTVLRAISLTVLAPGALLVAGVAGAWAIWSPAVSAVRVVMLLASGAAGLLFFQALGVWTSVLSPRVVPFTAVVGHRLPIPASLVLGLSILGLFGGPAVLGSIGLVTVMRYWWVAPLAAAGAAAFYGATLQGAGAVLMTRRDRLVAALDGRG